MTKKSPLSPPKEGDELRPVWRLRLEMAADPSNSPEIEVNGEVVLGSRAEAAGVVNLGPYGAVEQGVSRRHLRLWGTDAGLFVLDMHSTNGTLLNGQRMHPDTPYRVTDGDLLSLGKLTFVLRVLQGPKTRTQDLRQKADLADALAQLAKAITAQLDVDAVLDQALEMAMRFTHAGGASIWLVDEHTDELFLVAQRGIEDERIRYIRLPASDPLVSRVLESGKPFRTSRTVTGELVKVKTDYMVEALLYVPLSHAGKAFGVLAATHREAGKDFSSRDERLLTAIADFAAIAVQNARLYRRLREADREKAEMIQNVAHEFRTPLQYIIGYVDLMMDDDTFPEEHRKSLQIVIQQADRLKWLVDNFVALQSTDEIVTRRVPTSVGALLAGIAEGAAAVLAQKNLRFSLEVAEGLPDVFINPMTVYQVLDNLISNAIKFTPEGGEIAVSARLAQPENKVYISVRDTGIGIPEELHERVFERFFQVDGSPTRPYSGTGLGLAVCKAIVEAHGGRIWVEKSQPGQGTTFTFTLPIASDAREKEDQPSA